MSKTVASLAFPFLFSFFFYASAQSQPSQDIPESQSPQVGKPMPDFTLENIHYHKTTTAQLKDFRGKWLILDFWSSGCLPCMKSWPKMNRIQEKFKDSLWVMLVGCADRDEKKGNWNNMSALISLHDRLREKQKLNLAAAYDQENLWKRWEVTSVPHIYIIDPNGIVKHITSGTDLTEEKIQQLLNGGTPEFKRKDLTYWDPNEILRMDSSSILYTSILSKFQKSQQFFLPTVKQSAQPDWYFKGFFCSGASLKHLYNYAYIGVHHVELDRSLKADWYPFPVLEVKDSADFVYDKNGGEIGRYNYAIRVPNDKQTAENLMKLIQDDLKKYFGYNVSIEKRKMPVWKLIANPGAVEKLKAKGGEPYTRDEGASGGPAGIVFKNWKFRKVSSVIYMLTRNLDDYQYLPYLMDTDIFDKMNVDIELDCDMSNRQQLIRELRKYNLDLIKGEKEYKVIVIR
jgi:peroxiredoxin